MADYRPMKSIDADKLAPEASYFLALGIRLVDEPDPDRADGKSRAAIWTDEVDAALLADVNAMLQLVLSDEEEREASAAILSSDGGSSAELRRRKSLGPHPETGLAGLALLAYEALSSQIMVEVSDEDEPCEMSSIRRSAVEGYPFFTDGQHLAQHTGLLHWDVLRDQPPEKGR